MWRVASDDTSGCNTRAGGSGALAWASILGSYSLFRQMAHVSAASRAAPQRGVCAGVRSAGAVGTGPRLAGWRAGAPVHMSQDQNVTAFLCSERHTLRRQAAGRAAATTTGSQRGTGGRCERRTISSRRSGAPPCCPSPRPSPHRPPFPSVETATMRDASVRRTASRVQVFCARTRSARGVCEGWHAVEARGSGSTRATQRSGSTRSIYTSAMCDSGVLTLSPPLPAARVRCNPDGREMGAHSHRGWQPHGRCVGARPPPTRSARAGCEESATP